MVIEPTPGRIVHYRPSSADLPRGPSPGAQPLAAIISHVWGARLVSLTVFSMTSLPYAMPNVILVQEGDEPPKGDVSYCHWMPYQQAVAKGQIEATKHTAKVKP